MRKKLASVAAAAAVAVTGVTYVATTSGAAIAQEGTTIVAEDDQEKPAKRGQVLESVLGSLVDDGTITQDQSDAITSALATKVDEIREQFPDGGRRHRGPRGDGVIRDMLEDGVIDADELASLGADHPLNDPDGPAAQYLDDGQLDQDELKAMREERRANRPDHRVRPPASDTSGTSA